MILVASCSCVFPIHWSLVLSREWRCSWSSAVRWCSNYIWVIANFISYYGAAYIRGLTVIVINHNLLASDMDCCLETRIILCPITLRCQDLSWLESHYDRGRLFQFNVIVNIADRFHMPVMEWYKHRADSRLAPSQWETALLCNDVSYWLGASLESAL